MIFDWLFVGIPARWTTDIQSINQLITLFKNKIKTKYLYLFFLLRCKCNCTTFGLHLIKFQLCASKNHIFKLFFSHMNRFTGSQILIIWIILCVCVCVCDVMCDVWCGVCVCVCGIFSTYNINIIEYFFIIFFK